MDANLASGATGSGAESNIADEEVRQIATMSNRMEVDDNEKNAIVEADQLEEYTMNVELAQQ